MRTLYAVYGAVVLLGLSVAQYQGWSLASVNQMKNVPRSVRDNPGSYRSVYRFYPHYTGGK